MWSSCTRWQNYWGIESHGGEPLLQLGSQLFRTGLTKHRQAALRRSAAIDTDGVARDPTSLFGSEERDDTANIIAGCQAFQSLHAASARPPPLGQYVQRPVRASAA